jgi:hypothetical protein
MKILAESNCGLMTKFPFRINVPTLSVDLHGARPTEKSRFSKDDPGAFGVHIKPNRLSQDQLQSKTPKYLRLFVANLWTEFSAYNR